MEEKNENIKEMRVLLMAAQSRVYTAEKTMKKHGGQD